MKRLAAAALALMCSATLQGQAPVPATPFPAATPGAVRAPFTPVILVDPHDWLPSPAPRRRAAPKPRPRKPVAGPTPDVFERYDTKAR